MSSRGRLSVYRRETEGVYQREIRCLPEGDRLSTRWRQGGCTEGNRKSTSKRQRMSTRGEQRFLPEEVRLSTKGRQGFY